MNKILLILVIYVVLFASAVEESKEDETEELSAKLLRKESQLRWQLRRSRSNDERSERINRGFEKAIHLVNVLGKVDDFFYVKTRDFIRKLNAMYITEEDKENYSDSESQ